MGGDGGGRQMEGDVEDEEAAVGRRGREGEEEKAGRG